MTDAERDALMEGLLVIEREECEKMSDDKLARRLGNLSKNADPDVVAIVRAEVARRGLRFLAIRGKRLAFRGPMSLRCALRRQTDLSPEAREEVVRAAAGAERFFEAEPAARGLNYALPRAGGFTIEK